MSTEVSHSGRINNLAYAFQEPLTAILRVRSQPQQVSDTAAFRVHIRRLLQTSMGDARSLGYAPSNIQMSLLAVVGFLDESVLNLPAQSPLVADWARRPLQEELFGGHLAGETVFANIAALLQQQDSAETVDVIELHALVLELGYKGRYAFSNGGELRNILQLCRQKIGRVRGPSPLFPAPIPEQRVPVKTSDPIARTLLYSAILMAVLTLCAFAGYALSLSSGVTRLVSSATSAR